MNPRELGEREKLLQVLLLKVKEGQRNAEQGMGMAQAHRELSGGFCHRFVGQQGTVVQEKGKKSHKELCSAPRLLRVQSKAVSTPPQGAHSPSVLWDALGRSAPL